MSLARTPTAATIPSLVHAEQIDWVPLRPGLWFKPLRFYPDDRGYQLLLRVDPGTVIARHRHTGDVHALVISGQRRIHGCAETLGAGSYVYEPVGNVDTWSVDEDADEPCIIHIEANGRIEYLDDEDRIVTFTDAATARAAYEDWCTQTGTVPHAALTRSHG